MNRKLFVSNASVALLAVVGLLYTLFALLHVNPFEDELQLTVELAETGGVFDKSEVTYRGKPVGRVLEVLPRDGGVVVKLTVDPDTQIPKDTQVVIGGLSPVGEQTVDFRPRTSSGPFLENGDVVKQEATTLPVPFHKLITSVSDLLVQVDTDDLHTVVDELYAGTQDMGPELRRLLGDTRTVLAGLVEVLPETKSLLNDGRRTLTTVDALTTDLADFSRSARELTRALRAGEPLYRSMLEQGPPALESTSAGLRELTPSALALMGDTADALQILSTRLPAFRAFLTAMPLGAGAVAASMYDGAINVIGDLTPSSLCSYGNKLKTPWVVTDAPADLTQHCERYGPDLQQRGSYFAPRSSATGSGR